MQSTKDYEPEEFFCLTCNHKYNSIIELDEGATDENDYCRYMGFCGSKCFNKLSSKQKNNAYYLSYIYGNREAKKHRAAMKYIPNYK
tara:strand:- start:1112 stop:1372 length:261 start_codon:yes stop_codon:yes gene_type:complete